MPAPVALCFDVFGTVADWRGTIVQEGDRYCSGFKWGEFADDWMREYGRSVGRLTQWQPLDDLMKGAYRHLMTEFVLPPDFCGDMADVWSRLQPFPDAKTGFARLARKYRLAALSNANRSMLDSLALSTGLPWSELISGEEVKAYKPDPAVYRNAIARLKLHPDQILMVAAHTFDLNAARTHGMRTALVARSGEPGSDRAGLDHQTDFVVADLNELADRLEGL